MSLSDNPPRGARANAPPQVAAGVSHGVILVRALSSLPDFDAYLAALGPTARYDRGEKGHILPLEDAPSIFARLRSLASLEVSRQVDELLSLKRNTLARDNTSAAIRLARAQLYPFQAEGVRWLTTHRSGLLADEMGLGKTAQALLAIPPGAPALVVCPAVAVGTWVREMKRWRPDLHPHPLSRASFAMLKAPLVGIVSYDSLPPDAVPSPGMCLIADEAHALKSPKAQRTQRFRSLSLRILATDGRVWLLTGTPLLNKPQELWSVLQAGQLALRAFSPPSGGSAWEHFVELFGGVAVPVSSLGKWAHKRKPSAMPGPTSERTVLKWTIASPKVRELLEPVMLRRKRADVLPELPTKTYAILSAKIDSAITRACNELGHRFLREGETVEAFHARLGGDADFEAISALLETLSTAKIPSMLDHVSTFEDQGEPLVVLSAHRRPIEALKSRRGWTTVLGGDSAADRASKVAGFQAGKYMGIAGTIQALGTSVTLTRASKLLFVSRLWTPDLNAQGEDRVCRIGQDRGVTIYDLVSNHPLDARISEVLREKTRLVQSVL